MQNAGLSIEEWKEHSEKESKEKELKLNISATQ
jgi:hypothetical protein